MKCFFRVKQPIAPCVRSRKLDHGLDTFAAGAAEDCAAQAPAGSLGQALCQIACQFGNVALQHRRPAQIEFILQCGYDLRMVVADVMNAIARKEIENAAAVRREQFHAGAPVVSHVHFQEV